MRGTNVSFIGPSPAIQQLRLNTLFLDIFNRAQRDFYFDFFFLYAKEIMLVTPLTCVHIKAFEGSNEGPWFFLNGFIAPLQGKTLRHVVVLCREETGAWLHGPRRVGASAWPASVGIIYEKIYFSSVRKHWGGNNYENVHRHTELL